jgi:hypothetical protein
MKYLLSLMSLAAAVWADFSPLDVNPNGIGTVTSPLGARERAMGNSGMATSPQPGVFLANPSRLAFQEKHSFSGTLETTLEYLHDDLTGNRRTDAFLPGLTLGFPSKKWGSLGLWYWQTSHRNFTFESFNPTTGVSQAIRAEGGLFELGASYSYAILPQLAVGLDIRKILGQERFIKSANVSENATGGLALNSESLEGDTTIRAADGLRQGISITFRQKKWSAALAIQTGTTLDLDIQRRITHITTDVKYADNLYLPYTGLLGIALKPIPGQTVTLDMHVTDWDSEQGSGLDRGMGVGAGYEWQGNGGFYDAYWKKCAFRAGGGYESLYLNSSWQGYATVGLGLPLGSRGHVVDISLMGGHREVGGNYFLAEEYLKLSVTVQGVGVWGQPLRRRR